MMALLEALMTLVVVLALGALFVLALGALL